MTKAKDILKTNYAAQDNWIRNQILKNNMGVFVNGDKAIEKFNKLKAAYLGQIPNELIMHFVAASLSDTGIKRLVTTLRVADSRAKTGFALQVKITEKAKGKLDYLAAKTGMKKNDIINRLLEQADLKVVKKREEQLEITL